MKKAKTALFHGRQGRRILVSEWGPINMPVITGTHSDHCTHSNILVMSPSWGQNTPHSQQTKGIFWLLVWVHCQLAARQEKICWKEMTEESYLAWQSESREKRGAVNKNALFHTDPQWPTLNQALSPKNTSRYWIDWSMYQSTDGNIALMIRSTSKHVRFLGGMLDLNHSFLSLPWPPNGSCPPLYETHI